MRSPTYGIGTQARTLASKGAATSYGSNRVLAPLWFGVPPSTNPATAQFAHANEEFFGLLERGWRLEATAPLDPYPGGAEKLWVCERRVTLPTTAPGAPGG